MSSHPDISLLSLRQALRADPAGCVAFVGAGGKTSAMFILAGEIVHDTGKAVFVTTTTHLAVEQAGLADWHFLSVDDYAASVSVAGGVVSITGARGVDGRLVAPRPQELSRLHTLAKEKGLSLLI
jgi:probable selenium-dependent hydroxylase accessory protein YqeC